MQRLGKSAAAATVALALSGLGARGLVGAAFAPPPAAPTIENIHNILVVRGDKAKSPPTPDKYKLIVTLRHVSPIPKTAVVDARVGGKAGAMMIRSGKHHHSRTEHLITAYFDFPAPPPAAVPKKKGMLLDIGPSSYTFTITNDPAAPVPSDMVTTPIIEPIDINPPCF